MRKLVTVLWGDDVIAVRTFPERTPIVAGDDDCAIALPTAPFVLPEHGAVSVGAFRLYVEHVGPDEAPPRPRRLPRPRASTVVSAALHLGALGLLALYTHVRPPDPAEERAQQMAKMQAYMGRIGEHDALVGGEVANDEANDSLAYERGAGGGALQREEQSGSENDVAGRALDDRTPSLAPLVYVPVAPTLGAMGAADERPSSPSTLAPKLALTPRAKTGTKGNGGAGGGGPKGGGGSNCVAFASSPLHDVQKSTWIEFTLEDGRGHPVPNQRYRVTLPDGRKQEGLTDARGLVCLTGVAPGEAQIEWVGVQTTYVGSSPTPI
jgi:hypothetical protein